MQDMEKLAQDKDGSTQIFRMPSADATIPDLMGKATLPCPTLTIVKGPQTGATFKLDEQALAKAGVTARDITAETIPEDFSRNQRIHRCYLVQRAPRPKDDARPEGARRGGRRPGSGRS